jgi:hypothetical protein
MLLSLYPVKEENEWISKLEVTAQTGLQQSITIQEELENISLGLLEMLLD